MKKLPAGTYFIGDPCYCFNDHSYWGKILGANNYYKEIFTSDEGFVTAAEDTAYGDGGYLDQWGNNFSVDAGMIGATDVRMVSGDLTDLIRLGLLHTFAKEFTVDSDGRYITIGNDEKMYKIDTIGDDEEDYDY